MSSKEIDFAAVSIGGLEEFMDMVFEDFVPSEDAAEGNVEMLPKRHVYEVDGYRVFILVRPSPEDVAQGLVAYLVKFTVVGSRWLHGGRRTIDFIAGQLGVSDREAGGVIYAIAVDKPR